MREHLAALVDLVLPGGCAGCTVAVAPGGTGWCPACAAGLGPVRFPLLPGGPQVRAAGPYTGPLRTALLRYKERGRRDLVHPLAGALAALLPGTGPVHLVPAPSRPSSARARGGDHVLRLARAVAGQRADVHVHPVLALARRARDSVGLTPPQRAANLAEHLRIRGLPPPQVVLVDDVVTTGATLRTSRAVLAAAGARTVGAVVLCDASGLPTRQT